MKLFTEYIFESQSLNSILNTLSSSKRYTSKEDEQWICKTYNLKKCSLRTELRNSDDYIMLDMIESNGKGAGTKFMTDLCTWADNNHKILTLSPTDQFVGKRNLNRLIKFYKRFGFKENIGRKTDFKTHQKMLRLNIN